MQFSLVPVAALRKRDQWKVEYFVAEIDAFSSRAYPMVKLSEVLTERRETLDPTEFPQHMFNYVGLENVESRTGDLIEFKPCTGETVRSRSKIFRDGDVLYGRLRPYLNKVLYVADWLGAGICSGEFLVLQCDGEVLLPEFCRHVLASSLVQERVSALQVGSTHPRLAIGDLLDMSVPLPPLETQREMLAAIHETESFRQQAKTDARELTSLLSSALVSSLEAGSTLQPIRGCDYGQQRYGNSLPAAYAQQKRSRRLI